MGGKFLLLFLTVVLNPDSLVPGRCRHTRLLAAREDVSLFSPLSQTFLDEPFAGAGYHFQEMFRFY